MMTRSHKILTAVLAAQLLLAAALLALQWRSAAEPEEAAVASMQVDAVDRLTIEGPDQLKTVLTRQGGQWRVAQAGDFPADAARVRQLLERVAGLKSGLPVATSADGAERFRVADTNFERRLTAEGGGRVLANLLVGSAQGARRSHVRRAGEHEVLLVELAVADLPAKDEEWLDMGLLQLPRSDIDAIEVGDLRLVRQDARAASSAAAASSANTASAAQPAASAAPAALPTWVATGLAEGEQLDATAVEKLAGMLAGLRIGGVLGTKPQPTHGLDKPASTLTVVRKGGQRIEYRLGRRDGSDDYALQVSTRPEILALPGDVAKPLIEAVARTAPAAPADGAAGRKEKP
jgi:hypothetical protein